jgi:TonB family protein
MMFVIIAALLLCGCASLQPPDSAITYPEVLSEAPLPAWPFRTNAPEIVLTIKVRVGNDGSVKDALLMTGSGSEEWDSLALAQIRKWRYSPARVDGQPFALWVRQTVRMRFEQPLFMVIAELACSDRSLADSLYVLLRSGMPFDSLARQFSVSMTRDRGGMLGEINVRTLPYQVRRDVAQLHEGEITRPLELGNQFVIYKRLPRGA